MAEEVTEPSAQEQEAAEREQIGVHDPGQRRLREAEVGLDRRQRHVHDRRVEDDHQAAGAEEVERQPARAAFHGHQPAPFRTVVFGGLDRGILEKSSVVFR